MRMPGKNDRRDSRHVVAGFDMHALHFCLRLGRSSIVSEISIPQYCSLRTSFCTRNNNQRLHRNARHSNETGVPYQRELRQAVAAPLPQAWECHMQPAYEYPPDHDLLAVTKLEEERRPP